MRTVLTIAVFGAALASSWLFIGRFYPTIHQTDNPVAKMFAVVFLWAIFLLASGILAALAFQAAGFLQELGLGPAAVFALCLLVAIIAPPAGMATVQGIGILRCRREMAPFERRAQEASRAFEREGFPRYPHSMAEAPLIFPGKRATTVFLYTFDDLPTVQAFYDARLDGRWVRDDRLGPRRYLWLDAPGEVRAVCLESGDRSRTRATLRRIDAQSFLTEEGREFLRLLERRRGFEVCTAELNRELGGADGLSEWFARRGISDFSGRSTSSECRVVVAGDRGFTDMIVGCPDALPGARARPDVMLTVYWQKRGRLFWVCGLKLSAHGLRASVGAVW